MQKFYLLLILFTVIFAAKGQESSILLDKKIWIGGKFGFNNSFLTHSIGPYGTDSDSWHSYVRSAPQFGLAAKADLNKVVGVYAELAYASKGGLYRKVYPALYLSSQKEYFEKIYAVNYLELPLLLSLNLSELVTPGFDNSRFAIVLKGGLAPAILLNANFKYNDLYAIVNYHNQIERFERTNYKERIYHARKTNVSLITDLCLQKNMGGIPMLINFRYDHTLQDLYTITHLDGFNMQSASGTFGLGMTLLF